MCNKKLVKENRFEKIVVTLGTAIWMVNAMNLASFAAAMDTNAGLSEFKGVIDFIAVWIGRLGIAVAFMGGVQTAFAFKNDDADGKTKGLRTLISGFIVFGVSKATTTLFNIT